MNYLFRKVKYFLLIFSGVFLTVGCTLAEDKTKMSVPTPSLVHFQTVESKKNIHSIKISSEQDLIVNHSLITNPLRFLIDFENVNHSDLKNLNKLVENSNFIQSIRTGTAIDQKNSVSRIVFDLKNQFITFKSNYSNSKKVINLLFFIPDTLLINADKDSKVYLLQKDRYCNEASKEKMCVAYLETYFSSDQNLTEYNKDALIWKTMGSVPNDIFYRSLHEVYEVFCTSREIKRVQYSIRDEQGKVVKSYNSSDLKPRYVSPNTVGFSMYDATCNL